MSEVLKENGTPLNQRAQLKKQRDYKQQQQNRQANMFAETIVSRIASGSKVFLKKYSNTFCFSEETFTSAKKMIHVRANGEAIEETLKLVNNISATMFSSPVSDLKNR